VTPLTLLDLSLPDPALNLALDEALLLAAEEDRAPEVLRLWESAVPMIVLGAGGSVAIDVNRAACEADGVPILRRSSGGGTVLLGPGCLAFSLIVRMDRAPGLNQIQPATRYVLNRTLNALQIPGAAIEGTSDLAVSGRKFSGNAQQRKRTHFLHHGTLLFDCDFGLVSKFLHAPERKPDYRGERGHDSFLMNLPLGIDELRRRLIQEWNPTGELIDVPLARAERLADEKHRRDEWNFRR
jgi:lipoate-protein ligase A